MKVFAIVFAVIVAVVSANESDSMVLGASYGGASYGAAPAAPAAAAPAAYGGASASYGGSSYNIPSPPCPKNYLFGCHPVMKPVPCSAPAAGYGAPAAGGYGSAGAYSHYVPNVAVY